MLRAIRKYCDDNPDKKGQFILTGSSSNGINTPHTGTLRISTLEMLPMSLYETEESNGSISIQKLFDNPTSDISCKSNLGIQHLIFSICRGGWPKTLVAKMEEDKLSVAKEIYNQTCNKDISAIDQIKRSPTFTRSILKSVSRNICTLANKSNIFLDVKR